MIHNRDFWANPYRNHVRHNGIRADRTTLDAPAAAQDSAGSALFTVIFSAVLGFAAGVIVMLLAVGM